MHFFKLLNAVFDKLFINIAATKMRIMTGRLDIQDSTRDAKDGGIERAAAQIEN